MADQYECAASNVRGKRTAVVIMDVLCTYFNAIFCSVFMNYFDVFPHTFARLLLCMSLFITNNSFRCDIVINITTLHKFICNLFHKDKVSRNIKAQNH